MSVLAEGLLDREANSPPGSRKADRLFVTGITKVIDSQVQLDSVPEIPGQSNVDPRVPR